jgi:hypothetical protein
MVFPVVRETKVEVSLDRDEKSCEEYMRSPYRKPTQVDRKRILRPAGEGLLRNSAS